MTVLETRAFWLKNLLKIDPNSAQQQVETKPMNASRIENNVSMRMPEK